MKEAINHFARDLSGQEQGTVIRGDLKVIYCLEPG